VPPRSQENNVNLGNDTSNPMQNERESTERNQLGNPKTSLRRKMNGKTRSSQFSNTAAASLAPMMLPVGLMSIILAIGLVVQW
jgi:hypothetical protein